MHIPFCLAVPVWMDTWFAFTSGPSWIMPLKTQVDNLLSPSTWFLHYHVNGALQGRCSYSASRTSGTSPRCPLCFTEGLVSSLPRPAAAGKHLFSSGREATAAALFSFVSGKQLCFVFSHLSLCFHLCKCDSSFSAGEGP